MGQKVVIKTGRAVELMRKAGQAAARVREQLIPLAVPGISTGELDRLAAEKIHETGGKSAFLGYNGFPGQICISVNEEIVHGIGGTRKLLYGDVLKLDIGVNLDGYIGDTAVSVAIGVVDSGIAKLMQVTKAALAAGIEQARSGNTVGHIGYAVEQVVIEAGFTVVRDLVGHGVGAQLHEAPQIPNYGKPGYGEKLKPGMTLAIEPMVNMGTCKFKILSDQWTVVTLDGKPSCHDEHTVLVTKGDPEILTCRLAM